MRGTVLLLGDTGKVGTAVKAALGPRATIVGANSRTVDGSNIAAVEALVDQVRPDVVVNTIAFLGVEACEKDPERAFRMNTLMPRALAQRSETLGYTLVHFSSESVFSGAKLDFYGEDDAPDPLNIYGLTKYMADLVVRSTCARHFLFRIPVQFGEGPKRNQLLERMIDRARAGEALRIADDLITSPTYSHDVAGVVRQALEGEMPYGLYHVTNSGSATLYELVTTALEMLGIKTDVARASYRDFPMTAKLHTVTPLRQDKLPPLRHWRDALADYCARASLNQAA